MSWQDLPFFFQTEDLSPKSPQLSRFLCQEPVFPAPSIEVRLMNPVPNGLGGMLELLCELAASPLGGEAISKAQQATGPSSPS